MKVQVVHDVGHARQDDPVDTVPAVQEAAENVHTPAAF